VAREMPAFKGEMLEDTVFRVLTRKEMQSVMTGCVGVGSPFIVHDPDTYEKYMLFTAWTDVRGLARRVWVAPIDGDLVVDLKKAREIANPALFGVTGLNTAAAFWDDYNEEWVFSCTAYGAPKKSYAYFIFFDNGWNVRGTQVIDFDQIIDTQAYTPDLGDAGIGLVPHFDRGLTISAGFDVERNLYYISDYTARPLPTATLCNPARALGTTVVVSRLCSTYTADKRDVHQLLTYNGRLIMLSEMVQFTGLWHLDVCFGPEKDWYKTDDTVILGKFHMPCPITWSHVKINYTYMIGHIGHPHYTALLGKPLLFHTTFPGWDAGGKRPYAHEIWAGVIEPEEAFDPGRNFPLVFSSSSEPYLFGNIAMPTFGADSAKIYVTDAAAAGTLTIIEASSPYDIWAETTSRIIHTEAISAGANKIIWDKPAPYMGLKTDVDAEFMVVLK